MYTANADNIADSKKYILYDAMKNVVFVVVVCTVQRST